MKKLISIPYFLNTERTPLVDQLLEIVKNREEYIRELEVEIRHIKKLPNNPTFDKKRDNKRKQKTNDAKRLGSAKAHKTKTLPIHEVQVLKVENKPVDAKFKGYREFVIQEISIQLKNRVFKCERWRCTDGRYLQAALPKEYQGQHFGPYLRSYILHQTYHQGVTRNLLLGQLREWGYRFPLWRWSINA